MGRMEERNGDTRAGLGPDHQTNDRHDNGQSWADFQYRVPYRWGAPGRPPSSFRPVLQGAEGCRRFQKRIESVGSNQRSRSFHTRGAWSRLTRGNGSRPTTRTGLYAGKHFRVGDAAGRRSPLEKPGNGVDV